MVNMKSMEKEKKIQNDKEDVMTLAASRGFGLHRVGKTVLGVDSSGNYYLISESEDYEDLWRDAKIRLNTTNVFPIIDVADYISSPRDELKKSVVELAIKKRGLAVFHRGSELLGVDRNGKKVKLTEVDKEAVLQDKDLLWKKTLEILQVS